MNNDEVLRFPIGKFAPKDSYTQDEINAGIRSIEAIPEKIEAIAKRLTTKELDTPYRDGGWTARQVLHHLSDSHLNAYIRFKWTITENTPVIKAYDEKAWALTPETLLDPAMSVNLLKVLHIKWTALLNGLSRDDFKKEFTHPETGKKISLARMVATYAWHGEHHLAHIQIVAGK